MGKVRGGTSHVCAPGAPPLHLSYLFIVPLKPTNRAPRNKINRRRFGVRKMITRWLCSQPMSRSFSWNWDKLRRAFNKFLALVMSFRLEYLQGRT
jgi:hypothetical protein